MNSAIVYTAPAMLFKVFYPAFTKLFKVSVKTNHSIMHIHYFALGMIMFILFTRSKI